MTGSWVLDAFMIGSIILIMYPLLNFIFKEMKVKTEK